MTTTNPVVIPLSKSKIFLLLIGANVFVGSGAWLVFGNLVFDNALLDNPWFTKTVGMASIVFFGFGVYIFVGKLMSGGPGLVIDEEGIMDYSSAIGTKIYWKDVLSIEVLTIQSQRLILIKVTHPQAYIEGQANRFKRKMMRLNYKWYGTPLSISANGLRVSFEDLLQFVSERFETYKNGE